MSLYTTEFTCHKHGKVRTASQSFSSSMLASSGFCLYKLCTLWPLRHVKFRPFWLAGLSVATPELNSSQLERSVTSQRASTLVGAKSCSQYDVDARRNATLFPASYCEPAFIRPRAVTRCNLAVSDMYMRDFGKTHQIAYTYCSVGISDLKPLTGTSADQLPHRKSRSLATA